MICGNHATFKNFMKRMSTSIRRMHFDNTGHHSGACSCHGMVDVDSGSDSEPSTPESDDDHAFGNFGDVGDESDDDHAFGNFGDGEDDHGEDDAKGLFG